MYTPLGLRPRGVYALNLLVVSGVARNFRLLGHTIKQAIASVGVAAQHAKRAIFYSRYPGSVLVAHWLQHTLCYAWLYIPTSQRGPIPSFVLSRKPGDEATRAIAGAQAEVAGARAPVCPSLATPLLVVIV